MKLSNTRLAFGSIGAGPAWTPPSIAGACGGPAMLWPIVKVDRCERFSLSEYSLIGYRMRNFF